MPTFEEAYPTIVDELAGRYGRPGTQAEAAETFEAIISALLGQSLEAKSVNKVVQALREAGLLEPRSLAESDPAEVLDALRDVGIATAPRALPALRRLARWIAERFPHDVEEIRDGGLSTSSLREELVAIPGIGPSTVDAILLFGLGRFAYPVDRATYRILVRHGWADPSTDYEEVRGSVEGAAAEDPERLRELAEWFERIGREFCRARVAKCERCPLRELLPEGGPREPGE